MVPTIVLLGIQGSGKGTQAALLARALRLHAFSIGSVFRDQIAKGTQFGRLAAPYVRTGQLVPDDVTSVMLRFALLGHIERGVILDGYPRTLGQARFLANYRSPAVVINVHISDAEALARLSGRWVCRSCDRIYHASMLPKGKRTRCRCGGRLIQRADDRPATIKKRIRVYHEFTEPVIHFYRRRGVLVTVDGGRPILEVAEDIQKATRRALRRKR